MGKAMRATADNPDLALVTGINTQRVIWTAWAIGGGLAAIAGILLAVSQAQLLPAMGWKFLIPLFAAVILGGIGNPYGALAGAFIIGVTHGSVNPMDQPQLQAGRSFRHNDYRAAGPAAGLVRRRRPPLGPPPRTQTLR